MVINHLLNGMILQVCHCLMGSSQQYPNHENWHHLIPCLSPSTEDVLSILNVLPQMTCVFSRRRAIHLRESNELQPQGTFLEIFAST